MSTLTLYMKSGNKIKVRFVKNWKVKVDGNVVTGLTIERCGLGGFSTRLILSSLDLSQIEAITESWF